MYLSRPFGFETTTRFTVLDGKSHPFVGQFDDAESQIAAGFALNEPQCVFVVFKSQLETLARYLLPPADQWRVLGHVQLKHVAAILHFLDGVEDRLTQTDRFVLFKN